MEYALCEGEETRRHLTIIKKLRALPQRLGAIIVFLLAWEIAVRVGLTYPAPIPPASLVFKDLIDLALSGILWKHAIISLERIFSGYALAVIIAIPLGFLVGWFSTAERYLDPLLQTLRQVPLLGLFPIFIFFFGIGELPKTLVIMLAAMWWILLSTISAVKNVDPFLVKTARSAGASGWDIFSKVVLPSAVPSIFTGLRLGSTEVILVLIAVERLGAKAGLGILLYREMWPVIVFMAILGIIANYMLVALERRLCRWKEEMETG
jgi:NitT/TauT family transport system permease protein